MYNNKKILALIPARGGSKGLPHKNIKPLCGKPLIGWTIEQAQKSVFIDRLIVSTDDEKIADIAKNYGAEAPFLRPSGLAVDDAKIMDAILHAFNWLESTDARYDLFVLLQPTSPLRISGDIDAAIKLLFLRNAQAIVSVCAVNHYPYGVNTLPSDGCMKDFIKPEYVHKNRQELPGFYRLNGAVYVAYVDYILQHRSFFGDKTFAHVMPQERSVDIDTEIDFKLAESNLRSHE